MADPVAIRPTFNTSIVSMLTELLRRAKEGEIAQIAFVFTEPDSFGYGTWISDRDTAGSTLTMIGAIADLQYTALRLHNEAQG